MNISIIIPNYNGAKLLEKNLPKVLEAVNFYKKGKAEIIIVDDASQDNSVLSIRNYVSSIKNEELDTKILENEENMGFSITVNRGVRESSGDVMILLNTDVSPEKNFLEPLLKHFKNEKVFAVGCMDRSIEKGKTILRGRGLGEWKRGFLVHRRGEIDNTNTLWVSGGSAAFKKSIWEQLGGLDKLYSPFYWEDIDLSYRALKSGYKIFFEPRSIVVHSHEEGIIKKKFSESKIRTIAYRNQFIFVWINITDLNMQFEHLIWLPLHFIKAILRLDIAFVLGFFEALILFPEIIKSSFRYQKLFIKKDRDILSSI